MHRKFPLLLATPLAAIVLTAATAQASVPLQPAGPWKIDYAPNECRLVRTFGTGDGAITLLIRRGGSPDQADLIIAGKALPKFRGQTDIEFRMQPSGTLLTYPAVPTEVRGRPERILQVFNADFGNLKPLVSSQQLAIATAQQPVAALELDDSDQAIRDLDSCYGKLLARWGIDPAIAAQSQPKRIGTPEQTNPGIVVALLVSGPNASRSRTWLETAWVTPMDYPTAALQEERGGSVVAALSLNAQGRVEQCRVVVGSGFAPLDHRTCEILIQRARYSPARDAAGVAIASSTVERIIWRIPSF